MGGRRNFFKEWCVNNPTDKSGKNLKLSLLGARKKKRNILKNCGKCKKLENGDTPPQTRRGYMNIHNWTEKLDVGSLYIHFSATPVGISY